MPYEADKDTQHRAGPQNIFLKLNLQWGFSIENWSNWNHMENQYTEV